MKEIGEEYIERSDLTERFHWLISEHLFNSSYEETEAEKKILSYVQVPWSLYPDIRWTGSWNGISIGGNKFSSFGCGICCLSNLYGTIRGERISPYRMFDLCKEHSSYRPTAKNGAIDWEQMQDVCDWLELKTLIMQKPAEYGDFQEQMKNTGAMIVLLCKDNDDTLWWYTNGHYVTIWEYSEETDSVFTADPSGLYNRERVPLSLIYAALKTKSKAQYMLVEPDEILLNGTVNEIQAAETASVENAEGTATEGTASVENAEETAGTLTEDVIESQEPGGNADEGGN